MSVQLHATLASAHDVAAYARGGHPGAAGSLLGDAVVGGILTGLVLLPAALVAVVFLGAAMGTGLRQLAAGRP